METTSIHPTPGERIRLVIESLSNNIFPLVFMLTSLWILPTIGHVTVEITSLSILYLPLALALPLAHSNSTIDNDVSVRWRSQGVLTVSLVISLNGFLSSHDCRYSIVLLLISTPVYFQGNIKFAESEDDSLVIENSELVPIIADLLATPPNVLEKALRYRVVGNKHGAIDKMHTVDQALYGRNAFAKVGGCGSKVGGCGRVNKE